LAYAASMQFLHHTQSFFVLDMGRGVTIQYAHE
jgi:hypothetical protein